MKIAIIITGQVIATYVDSIVECYRDCSYTKIVSTWDYTDSNLLEKLSLNGFLIVKTSYDHRVYKHSVNYQNITSKAGYIYAKSIGCTHSIRVRTDITISDINKLIDIYKQLYYRKDSKPIFLTYFHHSNGYLSDLLYFLDIDSAIDYVTPLIQPVDKRFTELFLQESYFNSNSLEILKNKVCFSIGILKENNIGFYWTKLEYKDQGNLIDRYINVIGCEK